MAMRFNLIVLGILTILTSSAGAQTFPKGESLPRPLSLREAVNYAFTHNPSLKVQAADEDAASANLDIARDQYIPRGYVYLQENRATGNVVPGAHFNMLGIPPISGPPTDRVFNSGAWGSTAGLALWYDVAHLAQKIALADAALTDQRSAQSSLDAQKLNIAFGAADAFAVLVQSNQQVRAADSALDRAQVFENTVRALVGSGLRPGADGARAAAETAAARQNVIRSEETRDLSEAQLAEALGSAGQSVEIVPGRLISDTSTQNISSVSVNNPFIRAAKQTAQSVQARQQAASLEFIPRVEIVAALFGRADGLFPGGLNLGSAQGLVPDTPNWAAGIVVTIPILEYPEIRARVDLAAADTRRATAQRNVVVQQVQTQIDSARTVLKSSIRAADEARIELRSSYAALDQAQARYKAGLYSIDPVAETLRLLAQAEADDAVARVNIWRARMLLARAVGDLGPLLDEISDASGDH
jgi:outer membrane protein